jgi:hypothetical protein
MDKVKAARAREWSAAVQSAYAQRRQASVALTDAILRNASYSERQSLARQSNAAILLHKAASRGWVEACE